MWDRLPERITVANTKRSSGRLLAGSLAIATAASFVTLEAAPERPPKY